MSDVRTVLRIGTWNINWAKPGTERGRCVVKRLAAPGCDLLCVTEGYAGILPDGGHLIDAGPDWGYAAVEGRRKVLAPQGTAVEQATLVRRRSGRL